MPDLDAPGAATQRTPPRRARREAKLALAMVAVFAAWTALFISLSGVVGAALGAPTANGEVQYLEAWWAWTAVTVAWMLPLFVGIGLAAHSRRLGGGGLALTALVGETAIVVMLAAPPLLDRLLHAR